MVTFTAYITYPVIFTVYLYSNIPIILFVQLHNYRYIFHVLIVCCLHISINTPEMLAFFITTCIYIFILFYNLKKKFSPTSFSG